jgi:hypothetical protein
MQIKNSFSGKTNYFELKSEHFYNFELIFVPKIFYEIKNHNRCFSF